MLKEELQPDFAIGNMATDLVEMTLQICNKQEDKTLRFPKILLLKQRRIATAVGEVTHYKEIAINLLWSGING